MRTVLLAVVVCCAAMAQQDQSKPAAKTATADIKDASGKSVGKAVFSAAQPHGVKLDLEITHLPAGKHAFHVHQIPSCDASEEFDTAGLRYDPTGEFYGNEHHAAHSGPSAGDPGQEVEVDSNGKGHLSAVFHNLTMGGGDQSLFGKNGTAIVFHSVPGAPGPTRIACGVILPPK